FHDYVYLRANPLGTQRELWYHAAGCECWLLVERDTRNHVIGAVRALRPPADDEAGGAP
ncbi:MAG: sarcosine oxidase subunit delta, partial [Gammaproteobacteria bacterium]|nr:sarcosine oxidase subunit delta [Gammaproteobacteria bacterium]